MVKNRKSILAISGSTRANSANEAILRSIADSYKRTLEVHLYTGIADLPHFNPDLDRSPIHPAVAEFRDRIDRADAIIICTPEYVFSLPGALKNAIEWTVSTTVFSEKPTALIVASGLGEKAFESLQLIMRTVGANVEEHSALLIQGARSKLDSNGHLVDPATVHAVKTVVDSLIESLHWK